MKRARRIADPREADTIAAKRRFIHDPTVGLPYISCPDMRSGDTHRIGVVGGGAAAISFCTQLFARLRSLSPSLHSCPLSCWYSSEGHKWGQDTHMQSTYGIPFDSIVGRGGS